MFPKCVNEYSVLWTERLCPLPNSPIEILALEVTVLGREDLGR